MTEKFEVIFYGDVINCVRDETGREYNLHETITILNKQQAIINALKKENKELKEDLEKGFDVPIPYVENSMRRLRAEHKVDEQQDTIFKLQDICGKSDGENMELRIENKRLQKELRQSQDVKEFSALFNQSIALQREIKDLKEENEQLRQKLDFYLLDEFEWKEKYSD